MLVFFGVAAALLACLGPLPTQAIDTVPALNTTKYAGRWYQVYADQYVYETDERDFVCVFADYGLLPGGNLTVHNSARIGTNTGPPTGITGSAFVPDASQPGKLAVEFEIFGIRIPPQPCRFRSHSCQPLSCVNFSPFRLGCAPRPG